LGLLSEVTQQLIYFTLQFDKFMIQLCRPY